MFFCLSAYAQQDSAIVAKGERLLNLGYGVTVKAKEALLQYRKLREKRS